MSEFRTVTDTVSERQLPNPVQFLHTGDAAPIIEDLDMAVFAEKIQKISSQAIKEAQPRQESYSSVSVPIDFESMTADARDQAHDKFSYVVRGGNIFEIYRSTKSPAHYEADAVNLLGPDMSLYLHGAHQARRVERLMIMQQIIQPRVFNALHTEYGNTEAAAKGYERFTSIVPNFSFSDVKYGILCGYLHDYGEAKLKVDKPYHLKNDPLYNEIERAAAVDYAQQLHTPMGASQEEWDILERRFLSDGKGATAPDAEELARVAMHLYPGEISRALTGTEAQTFGNVERGLAFAAVEKMEYVITALRAFEAVEYNRQSIQQDTYLTRQVLWLGVSSLINHVADLTKHAEKYIGVYNFIAFNTDALDRYFQFVKEDIELRARGRGELADTIFGMDPFSSYETNSSHSDSITTEQIQQRFLETSDHWDSWKDKKHMVRSVWEAFIGTDHAINSDQQDITFTHYTARQRRRVIDQSGKVALAVPINDQFGIGLDPEARRMHEESIYVNS
jgi:hypothetical protein